MGSLSEARRFSNTADKLLLGGAILFAIGYLTWAARSGALGNDFSIYWRTANAPIEAAYQQRWKNPFPYPPPTIVWLIPLRIVSPWLGYFLWTGISAGGLIAASWFLGGRRVALLTMICPAVIACIAVGQIGNLVSVIILLAASRRKGWLAGALFGLAISMKPQIAFAAPVILALRRDWAGVAGCAVAGTTVIAAELLLFGIEPWLAWIRSFAFFHRVVIAVRGNAASANLAGFAEFLGLPIAPFWLADIIIASRLIIKRARCDEPLELAALVVLASVFLSPYGIIYDLGAATPFFASRMYRQGTDARPFFLALLWPWTSIAVAWAAIEMARKSTKHQVVKLCVRQSHEGG